MTAIDIHRGLNGRTILLTGFTGFMGKVLTEKLLRCCPEVRHIYLVVREKKGRSATERMEEVLKDPLFSVLEKEVPKYRLRLTALSGDCSLPNLGLSDEDKKKVTDEVSMVFHGAATVRFDESLKVAYLSNVQGTKEVLRLAKEIKNLAVLVHISTAYANCHLQKIEERFYEAPMDDKRLEDMVQNMDDSILEAIRPKIIGRWPNTYSFTKAMAESIVKSYASQLPIVVFRPAIIVGTSKEPLIGWTDNLYGPTGIVVGAGCGVLRSMYCDLDCIANIVPVDMAVSAMLTGAIKRIQDPPADDTIPIYHFVSSTDNPLKWREFKRLIELHGQDVPPIKAIWCYFMTTHRYKINHYIAILFLHYLPAIILDTITKLTKGDNPNLYKIYRKIDKYSEIIEHFSIRSWDFTNDNMKKLRMMQTDKDRAEFNFDIANLNWSEFFYNYIRGLRVYLLKDGMETLPKARVRWHRFQIAQRIMLTIFYLFVALMAYRLFTCFLSITA
ncbi:fatty acyl-CoA reductase wat-like [Cimex lectularius]|uniref:Fatty acyl-CoA reductase n=1 Tax=Cimex lectularius TaxID=79782 RepID=A0A8I6S7Q0_CIMLE|nr:fatty acyl-CoA reductase wat-like [Cimex lectularius]